MWKRSDLPDGLSNCSKDGSGRVESEAHSYSYSFKIYNYFLSLDQNQARGAKILTLKE